MTVPAADPRRVPGPVNRVHFLDEQQRYRRASRRFSALAVLAVLITGIPACIVVTPLVYAIVLTIGHIVNAISPISPDTLAWLRGGLGAVADAGDATSRTAAATLTRTLLAIAVLVMPGALAILLLWLANRRLLRQVVVGHELEGAGTREPNVRDLEEQQIRNVVEEMAVAAGVRPPRLLIIDSDAVNAGAIGVGFDDATVLVTRGLLDNLDRDETQAVIGHVIGSIGNGDLKVISIIYSIYQTWGALALLINAPFASTSRRLFWRAIRAAFRGQGRTVDKWEAEQVSDAFLRGAVDFDDADIGKRMASNKRMDQVVMFLALPTTLAAYVVRFAVFISSVALIGPIVSFMWRTRRHLADAMAVQLTRNPEALARALRHFGTVKSAIPQGDAASLMFFTWPTTARAKDAVVGQFARMHPKLDKRERRLVALGADPAQMRPPAGPFALLRNILADVKRSTFNPKIVLLLFLFFVIVPILLVVALGLSLVVLVMLTMLSFMLMLVMMVVITWVLKLLFITIPGWIRR